MTKRDAAARRESRRRRRRLAAGVLVASVVGVTACSAGNAAPTVPRTAGAPVTTIAQGPAMLLAVVCLRQHGIVDLPDPTVVTSGPAKGESVFDKRAFAAYSESVVDQALTACSAALAQAGVVPRTSGPTLTQQEIQNRLALARCLRTHGVPNFPDPNPTTGDVTLPPGLTKTSPQLLAAAQACRALATAAGLTVPANPGGGGS